MRDYRKVIYLNLPIGGEVYKSWGKKDTRRLLAVFEGGYCIECGCVNNYRLNYDYVPSFVGGGDVGYRVVGFTCRDCGCEFKIRIY